MSTASHEKEHRSATTEDPRTAVLLRVGLDRFKPQVQALDAADAELARLQDRRQRSKERLADIDAELEVFDGQLASAKRRAREQRLSELLGEGAETDDTADLLDQEAAERRADRELLAEAAAEMDRKVPHAKEKRDELAARLHRDMWLAVKEEFDRDLAAVVDRFGPVLETLQSQQLGHGMARSARMGPAGCSPRDRVIVHRKATSRGSFPGWEISYQPDAPPQTGEARRWVDEMCELVRNASAEAAE